MQAWRGSGKELVGDSAGGCFQKPRKGHRYSSAMQSALGTNMMWGFSDLLVVFGQKTSSYYVVCSAFIFIQVSSCKKKKNTAISLLAD